MKMLMEFRIFGYVQAAIDMMIYNARNTDLIIQSVRYIGITNYYHDRGM